jgi:hypothetical protein
MPPRLPDVLRAAVQPAALARYGIDIEAKLGSDDHLAAHGRQCLTDQFFIGEGAVDLGGVEEGDAALHRRAQEGDHLLAIRGCPVIHAHPHTAKPDGGYFETAGA